jgi:hypothetical protein
MHKKFLASLMAVALSVSVSATSFASESEEPGVDAPVSSDQSDSGTGEEIESENEERDEAVPENPEAKALAELLAGLAVPNDQDGTLTTRGSALEKNRQSATRQPLTRQDIDRLLAGFGGQGNEQALRASLFKQLIRAGFTVEGTRSASIEASKVKPKGLGSGADLVQTRVVGGEDASIEEVPWQVGLVWAKSRNIYEDQFCGGSIISPRWIVTAAHCVDWVRPSQIDVVYGVEILPEGRVAKNQLSKVRRIIVHPSWDYEYSNDIALLELSRPLKFSSTVSPILIDDIGISSFSGTVSGWGSTASGSGPFPNRLQLAEEVPSVSDDVCSSVYGLTFDPSVMMCAGGEGVDVCSGDSGGPLATQSGSRWTLVGLTSWGPVNPCGQTGKPGVYTRISTFSDWIRCHSGLTEPAGGPYLCGDEDFLSVGDTLRVAPGSWAQGKVRIQWLISDPDTPDVKSPIRGATKATFVSRSAQYGKVLSVAITNSAGDQQIIESQEVGPTFRVTFQAGNRFVPCKQVRLVSTDRGKCEKKLAWWYGNTWGKRMGGLTSYEGTGYWASKEYSLPRNTLVWTWVLYNTFKYGNAEFKAIVTGRNPAVRDEWDEPVLLETSPPDNNFIVGDWSEKQSRPGKGSLLMGAEHGGEFDFEEGIIVAIHY